MSLALARKYRPATFGDLIGQEAVSQTLSLALENQRLSHAYLFSGLRGSGKTSTARIFAKALLCEQGPSATPCGTCTHCVMAAENRHMDIIEMDAASNRGIDDIKELIEHTKYKPSSARFKIFIIDEVHMLTNQAFNALLKTLEEPPDFVKFILATTDPLKLPATILSRTQHFRFKKIPQHLVVNHLAHILNLEGIGFEQEAIEIIARSGAGSLRDSLTLLDQAIVYSRNHVDVATVTGMLGIIEPSMLESLIDAILRKDHQAILTFIKNAADYEAEMILDELTLYLKEALLGNQGKLSALIIERFFRIIAEAKSLLSLGSDGEFVLSLTLFKMVEALQIKEIDSMIKALEHELKDVTPALTPTKEPKTTVTPEATITTIEVAPTPQEPKTQEAAEPTVVVITEEEILSPTPVESESVQPSAFSVQEEKRSLDPEVNTTVDNTIQKASTPTETIERSTPQATPTTSVTKASSAPQEKAQEKTPLSLNTEHLTQNTNKFTELVSKIYDRDYDLGSCFERNITFVSYEENLLTWESTAEELDKKMLITHWGLINMFVKEIFGFETKIKNIAKKKAITQRSEEVGGRSEEKTLNTKASDLNAVQPMAVHNDANSGSMIEEVEMKSSCIAPEAGETEAAKEKDPSTLMEEPMVKTAIERLYPKKVRIKRNV